MRLLTGLMVLALGVSSAAAQDKPASNMDLVREKVRAHQIRRPAGI